MTRLHFNFALPSKFPIMTRLRNCRLGHLMLSGSLALFLILVFVGYFPEKTVIQWPNVPVTRTDATGSATETDMTSNSLKTYERNTKVTNKTDHSKRNETDEKNDNTAPSDENTHLDSKRNSISENTSIGKEGTPRNASIENNEQAPTKKGKARSETSAEKVPEVLQHLMENVSNLKGRHSDYIMPECLQDNNTKFAWKTDEKFDFVGPFNYLKTYKNPCWLDEHQQLRCVPYFYLIGAPKAGSSDLFLRLRSHPQVLQGRYKEVRWWEKRRYEDKDMPNFEDYVNFYQQAINEINKTKKAREDRTEYHTRVIGDGSPTYYYSSNHWKEMPGNEGCPEPRVTAMSHIHHLWPQAKLVLLLRNPVTRLYSAYLYNSGLVQAQTSPGQFHELVLQAMYVWYHCLQENSFRYCMYETDVIRAESKIRTFAAGMYSRYVLDLLKIFPREQLFVVHLEDYSSNMKKWLPEIFEFLNLSTLSDTQLERLCDVDLQNKGKNYNKTGPMWPSTWKLLNDFYKPYNMELAAILDDERFLWEDKS